MIVNVRLDLSDEDLRLLAWKLNVRRATRAVVVSWTKDQVDGALADYRSQRDEARRDGAQEDER